jgi:hypothetical protein
MPAMQLKFPSVYIVNFEENNGNTNHIIRQTVNTAFGGEAVDKGGIRKCKNGWRKVNFKQVYDRPELFDDFYRDLKKHGSVWIASTYLGDEEYTQSYIAYSTVPLEGYWELRLA